MHRPGPGPQPLRGMSGFPGQQPAQARNATLASSRVPNGKIGQGANWNFNLPMGGAPGLHGHQQRNLGQMGSFAQSVGGSQPATPLDLSEFPSLSGSAQQSQTHSSAQAVWANAGQRATQTPVQRQQPPTSQPPSRASQAQSHYTQQSQPAHDDMYSTGAQYANRLDDFRNTGQGVTSQLGAGGQPQTGNVDDFPPLTRNTHADLGQNSRSSLLQSGVGNYGLGQTFAGQAQARNALAASINGQEVNRIMSPGITTSAGMTSSRPSVSQGPNGIATQDKEDAIGSGQRHARSEGFSEQDSGQAQQRTAQTSGAAGETAESSGAAQSGEQRALSQMSELDRFGLAGLLSMIHNESPDVASLTVGQDLMTLGLDLNQPEPLHPSFSSPFVSSMAAVPLEQDYSLPACYKVNNVQPLQSRIPSFSDETLFYIFYTMPRDVMQELAAEELMSRKWRYHKIERCWLTRDETYPGPVDVERGVSERGIYLLWDPTSWKKIRREFVLRYEDLDNRLDPSRGLTRTFFPQHAS
ncbi:hypothetical protein VTN49DRAFT_4158 [Thermomyces lanuginosus]|uniref:uncharacterized protein n=1 Tax=Thermomyces lanuginosus TaxID=5541 RepID=UPI003743B0F9